MPNAIRPATAALAASTTAPHPRTALICHHRSSPETAQNTITKAIASTAKAQNHLAPMPAG
jgi:hypothetical protein